MPSRFLRVRFLSRWTPAFHAKVFANIGGCTTGASNTLRALTIQDFPDDPDLIFLTSWGEWWGKDVLAHTLDKGLQDKWSPSKEEIESEEGLSA
jgi:hypothetical protein